MPSFTHIFLRKVAGLRQVKGFQKIAGPAALSSGQHKKPGENFNASKSQVRIEKTTRLSGL
jgi:hypothetical protein